MNYILKSIESLNNLKQKKLLLYFSGSIIDCYLLKTLLKKTDCQILVYYFNKSTYQSENSLENTKELVENLKILTYFLKNCRSFTNKEIDLSEFKNFGLKTNLDDISSHIKLFPLITKELGEFDYYISSSSKELTNNQFANLVNYIELNRNKFPIDKYLTPFGSFEKKEVIVEALSSNLTINDINFERIYNENKDFIEEIKIFEFKDDNKTKADKLINVNTDFNTIFRYLISKSTLTACTNIVEHYGANIDKKIYIHLLSNAITYNPDREKLVTYSVVQGKITDEELNQVLRNYVDNFAGFKTISTKEKIDEVYYFFNLYGHKITEETKDYLIWVSIKWKDWINEELLETLVDLGCDIGDLLIRTIGFFVEKEAEQKALIFIEKYKDRIHQLQLNEALLTAFQAKFFNLYYKLIEYGADKKIIQFHSFCYASNLWKKTSDIKVGRAYWRKKDRIIISEILKELDNPQNKVPPVFHITGSNGKGSVCAFLKSILEANGYKAHMFTSPSIMRDNENIIIAGQEISDELYYQYLVRVEEAFNKIKDTESFKQKIDEANKADTLTQKQIEEDNYLEWSFIIPVMALAFSENKADATIVEVVTGGEHDMTNIFDEKTTIATIINTIIYGDNHAVIFKNIEDTTSQKSRLSKNDVPIICSAQQNNVLDIIKKVANEKNSPLLLESKDWISEIEEGYFIYKGFGKELKLQKPNLVGDLQISNASIALTALLKNYDKFKIDEEKASKAINTTSLIGRLSNITNDVQKFDYKKIYFGTTKFGNLSIVEQFSQGTDLILTVTGYTNEFIGGLLAKNMKNFHQIILVKKGDNLIFNNKLQKISNFTDKHHLSSSITRICSMPSKATNLLILNTGVSTFPKNYLAILNELKQSNFKEDLEFAKKHKLLDELQLSIMEGRRIMSS